MNRSSIDLVRARAQELGYRIVSETDQLDTTGRITLLVEGYGEQYEAHFQLRPHTGYLAWDHGSGNGGRFIPSWRKLQRELEELREYGLSEGRTPYTPTEEQP